MDANKFAGMMKMIVPKIIGQYMKEACVSRDVAVERLYNSQLTKFLKTKKPHCGISAHYYCVTYWLRNWKLGK
jgi:hypothetical protein